MDNKVDQARRPGRPPIFVPQRRMVRELHLKMTMDLWQAVAAYCQTLDEPSASLAVRRLLRERLTELGYLKEGQTNLSLSRVNPQ